MKHNINICNCQHVLSEYTDKRILPYGHQFLPSWSGITLHWQLEGDITAGTWSALTVLSSKSRTKFHMLERSDSSDQANAIHGILNPANSWVFFMTAPATSVTAPPLPHSVPCFHSGGDGSQGRGRQQLLEETDEQHPKNIHFHGGPGIVSTTAALQPEPPLDTGFPAQGSDSLPGTGQCHKKTAPSETGTSLQVRGRRPIAAAQLLLVLWFMARACQAAPKQLLPTQPRGTALGQLCPFLPSL